MIIVFSFKTPSINWGGWWFCWWTFQVWMRSHSALQWCCERSCDWMRSVAATDSSRKRSDFWTTWCVPIVLEAAVAFVLTHGFHLLKELPLQSTDGLMGAQPAQHDISRDIASIQPKVDRVGLGFTGASALLHKRLRTPQALGEHAMHCNA